MGDDRSGGGSGGADSPTLLADNVRLKIAPDNSCTLIFLEEGRVILEIGLSSENADALAAALDPEARRKLWEEAKREFDQTRH